MNLPVVAIRQCSVCVCLCREEGYIISESVKSACLEVKCSKCHAPGQRWLDSFMSVELRPAHFQADPGAALQQFEAAAAQSKAYAAFQVEYIHVKGMGTRANAK